jgi:hypothetical protein
MFIVGIVFFLPKRCQESCNDAQHAGAQIPVLHVQALLFLHFGLENEQGSFNTYHIYYASISTHSSEEESICLSALKNA